MTLRLLATIPPGEMNAPLSPKTSLESLGIFGGQPLFSTPRPIGQLSAPDIDIYILSLRGIWERRWLSNDGPLVRELESRLGLYHETRHCIAVANAGLGIIMLLQFLANGRLGEVIMPAFSYRGLPHFARWAGQEPRFCDVEEKSQALDPRAVAAAINDRTTAILAVCNAHALGNIDELCRIARARDVPILFDSVNALGSTYRGRPLGSFGLAEIYSLHATKMLNGFEGGYITTNDGDLAEQLRWQRNFCLPGLAPPQVGHDDLILGMNAKLNELHAAMALLSLDQIDAVIDRNRQRFEAYQTMCTTLPGLRMLAPTDARERHNFSLAIMEVNESWPLSRDQTVALLRADGMEVSSYYDPTLVHSSAAIPGKPLPLLPVSDALSRRFMHLPSGELVSFDDIGRIAALLAFVAANGRDIAARLGEKRGA